MKSDGCKIEGEFGNIKPQEIKSFKCFIYDRPHRARECKREKLNALIMQGRSLKAEAKMKSIQRLNPLQHRCAGV